MIESAWIRWTLIKQELDRMLPVNKLDSAVLLQTDAVFVLLQVMTLPKHEQVSEVVHEINLAWWGVSGLMSGGTTWSVRLVVDCRGRRR